MKVCEERVAGALGGASRDGNKPPPAWSSGSGQLCEQHGECLNL